MREDDPKCCPLCGFEGSPWYESQGSDHGLCSQCGFGNVYEERLKIAYTRGRSDALANVGINDMTHQEQIKELIAWYQTSEGKKAFEELRARRFSKFVEPLILKPVQDSAEDQQDDTSTESQTGRHKHD